MNVPIRKKVYILLWICWVLVTLCVQILLLPYRARLLVDNRASSSSSPTNTIKVLYFTCVLHIFYFSSFAHNNNNITREYFFCYLWVIREKLENIFFFGECGCVVFFGRRLWLLGLFFLFGIIISGFVLKFTEFVI